MKFIVVKLLAFMFLLFAGKVSAQNQITQEHVKSTLKFVENQARMEFSGKRSFLLFSKTKTFLYVNCAEPDFRFTYSQSYAGNLMLRAKTRCTVGYIARTRISLGGVFSFSARTIKREVERDYTCVLPVKP